MHYLVVFSRLRAERSAEQIAKVAQAVLGLNRKLENWQLRIKQSWSVRLPEVVDQLSQRDPRLAELLLKHPDFVNASHVAIANALDADHRQQDARLLLKPVLEN